jgi:hypothetical protein
VRKPSEDVKNLVLSRIAEGATEGSLLWIVFSALDALVTNRLTFAWGFANTTGALVVWTIGIYIEIRVKESR